MQRVAPVLDRQLSRKFAAWAWAGAYTTAAQGLIQALGFLSGIVVVRMLSPREYAFYTIACAGLGTMTVLTDSGVNNGVLAAGGAVWQDRARLGTVIATGLHLRMRMSVLGMAVGVPMIAVLLRHQGASWLESAVITASILPVFLATVSGHMLEVVPKLHQAIAPLQRIQVIANAGRAVLVALTTPFWPSAAAASFVTALPQWWANWRMRRLADRYAAWRASTDYEVRSRVLAQVRRTMPATIYYALSGQLTVWIISLFGSSGGVAAVGALSRFAVLLGVMTTVVGTLAAPRFSRIPRDQTALIGRRFVQIQLILAVACAVPLAALVLFPGPALSILGPHYLGLRREVVLTGLSGAIAALGGTAFGLAAARGVVAPPWLVVPYSFVTQLGLVLLLPVSTVAGVIWVGLLSSLLQWVLHAAYFGWRLRRRAEGPFYAGT